jgi:hypothetical protein
LSFNLNLPTFKRSLNAITGLPGADYLPLYGGSPAQSSCEKTGEFGLMAFPFDAGEGLAPRFPFSLTG